MSLRSPERKKQDALGKLQSLYHKELQPLVDSFDKALGDQDWEIMERRQFKMFDLEIQYERNRDAIEKFYA